MLGSFAEFEHSHAQFGLLSETFEPPPAKYEEVLAFIARGGEALARVLVLSQHELRQVAAATPHTVHVLVLADFKSILRKGEQVAADIDCLRVFKGELRVAQCFALQGTR
mmetsp:Transcript_42445/g.55987  ORF Transcript_42445/g.55987 Transcript_42445/m.55987 type:complete len:110 (+) Transcript_42445:370-699(+)